MRKTKRWSSKGVVDLRRRLATHDRKNLWSLAIAAGAAPGVRHRWASVGYLTYAIAQSDTSGGKTVRAHELERLLAACLRDDPRLGTLEDFVPSDPREKALVRIGNDVVRLFPGNVERPVADVDRALLVADAVDGTLVGRLGFGVRHLLEAALRYSDEAIRGMAPSWPTGDLPGDGRVTLTDAEVASAARLADTCLPSGLSGAPELVRALEWATCDAPALPYTADDPNSTFGRFLRVRWPDNDGRADWLPLAFLPEITGYGVNELAKFAAASSEANHRFAQLAAAQIRRALWRFSTMILGPDDGLNGPVVTPRNTVQWVAMLGPGRALLVQMVARLSSKDLPFDEQPAALAVAEAAKANPEEPIVVPMAGRTLRLDSHTEVVPLLVVACAGHVAAPSLPGMVGMSLDDLRWAASSAKADSDLFLFCRDMARPDLPRFFGWEAINTWEWWQANGKAMFAGGQSPTFISIAPHHGDAEWKRAVELAEVEQALATLQLPALRNIDGIDHSASGPPAIYQWLQHSATGADDQVPDTADDPANVPAEDAS